MVRALSTSACRLPAPPAALLERWRELAAQRIDAVALDARLDSELQAELLQLCGTAGLACPELTHSGQGRHRRRAASPISADRDERAAAVEQLTFTLRLAAEAGARRVLLVAPRLALSVSRDALARRFALGRDPDLTALAEERAALAGPALAHLSLVLDEVSPLCADLSLSLLLPVPAAWPDQLPDATEAAGLLELLRGAPLGTCYGTDWAAVAAALGGREMLEARAAEPGLASLRVADASGLRLRLAPGVGQVRFERALAGVHQLDQVLAPGPEVWPQEIARALDILDALPTAD